MSDDDRSVDRSIQGVAKTISEVLANKKYSIDYYQREYKWESKQIAELVSDLAAKFLELYDPSHSRREVGRYPGYFLGSIIISQKGEQPYVVDGQQRLTSLTLVLTYLRRLQLGRTDAVDIDQLIFSELYGEKSFNLEVVDRNDCMQALFETGTFEPPSDASESVQTLVARYSELEELFPEDLREQALPYFIDWLKDRVQLVEITAYNDDDAYAIFETMNDRGLKLTPADMLKGYLLSNIEDGAPRTRASDTWRKRIRSLNDQGDDASSDFLKAWLRSRYAITIRERSRGAKPEDWDRIGTEFHRWLRNAHEKQVGLRTESDFYDFVTRDLDFYGRQYERIVQAAKRFSGSTSPLRFIRYVADWGFTLQDQLFLAPLNVEDSAEVIDQKLEVVGRYLDILLAWRIWNSRTTSYSAMYFNVFGTTKDIRGLGVADLAGVLHESLEKVDQKFDSSEELILHSQNRRQLHKLLARLTDYLVTGSAQASVYDELTNGTDVKYEVEHVWADHHELHTDEFPQESEFARHRNRIGDLLLLPKQFNGSYNDDPYESKVVHYASQNLLAATLNPLSYERNPGFNAFVRETRLEFKAYDSFTRASITERGELYRAMAMRIWNPQDLLAV